jgi:hypothetical protein
MMHSIGEKILAAPFFFALKKSLHAIAAWSSHPPEGWKTWVQIPPGFKFLRENVAALLHMYAKMTVCIVCGIYFVCEIKAFVPLKNKSR